MDIPITGNDIVRAFTEADVLDKPIVEFESTFEDGLENGIEFTLEESSEYIGNDKMEFVDLKLAVNKHGWTMTKQHWVG